MAKVEYVVQEVTKDKKIVAAVFELDSLDEKQSADNFVCIAHFTKESYLKEKQKDGCREFFNEELLSDLLSN